jgi:hypothetical protein
MKTSILVLTAVSTLLINFTSVSAQSADSLIVGSWRLVSWVNADGRDRCTGSDGEASGQIIYSADGHMSAQLGCGQVEVDTDSGLSAQQLVSIMTRRHLSYYGSFTIDERAQTVTHHVMGSSILNGWVGSDQVRSYTFETNDRVTLQPPGGAKLTWQRN